MAYSPIERLTLSLLPPSTPGSNLCGLPLPLNLTPATSVSPPLPLSLVPLTQPLVCCNPKT